MSGPATRASLQSLNAATPAGFVEALGGVFEGSPWVAEAALASRPYASLGELHAAMATAVAAAGPERQLALIRAHPDLGARVRMSEDSVREQAGAGLDRLPPPVFERFQALNAVYKERFGFPFVVAVREHTPESILEGFERRLGHGLERERETALGEIAKIARYRLLGLLGEG